MAASKSTNSGVTWTYYQITASDGVVCDLVVDHGNSNVIYAGGRVSTGARVYRTTNSGTSWVSVSSGLSGDSVCALAMDPTNNSILYAATTDGIYKTTNSGSTWDDFGLNDVRAIVIRPDDTDILYAGTGTGVFESSNGGSSWTAINDGLDNNDVITLALNANIYLYAGTNGSSIYRMTVPVGISESGDAGFERLILMTILPNPICSKALLSYCLRESSNTRLTIYDVQGRQVTELVNERKPAGTHEYIWDTRDDDRDLLAEGVYFCKLETDTQTVVQKLIIVR
jgi:photosystem II stability/assembly factor-like uncharacterized protein